MQATNNFLKLALLGYPVSHSASPAMHNAALSALGIPGKYELCPTPRGELAQTLKRLTQEGFTGLNITLPHKQEALQLADEAEESAKLAGAANVLYRLADKWVAANTDGEGLYRSLLPAFPSLRGVKIVWLGAGGATLTAASFLLKSGAKLIISARNQEKGEHIAKKINVPFVFLERESLRKEFADCQLLIQATSASLFLEESKELLEKLPLSYLAKGAVICDLVYRPKETRLLQNAKALGFSTIDGSRMLLYQGALAFARFTGREAPITAMERALEAELA
jgi:shikimate dehydrogenase